MTRRLAATVAIAATLTVAIPATAGAAPSRVTCEQVAVAAANAAARPHEPAWDVIYTLAYARCLNGGKIPDYRKPTPKRWYPTLIGWLLVPAWTLP